MQNLLGSDSEEDHDQTVKRRKSNNPAIITPNTDLNDFLGSPEGNIIKVHILSQLLLLGQKIYQKNSNEISIEDEIRLLTKQLADRMHERLTTSTVDGLFKQINQHTPPTWFKNLTEDDQVANELMKLQDVHPDSTFLKYCKSTIQKHTNNSNNTK